MVTGDVDQGCNVNCHGMRSCMESYFDVTSASSIQCAGIGSCLSSQFVISPSSFNGDFIIACDAVDACNTGDFSLVNDASDEIEIKKIGCNAKSACQNAVFDFSSIGTGSLSIALMGMYIFTIFLHI